jgi:hypothetical protein
MLPEEKEKRRRNILSCGDKMQRQNGERKK